jgi:hypothetical protein
MSEEIWIWGDEEEWAPIFNLISSCDKCQS